MKELVMFLLNSICDNYGELETVNMYDNGYATIKFSDDESMFEISINRKDKEDK